jgi:hypothetical protein
MSRARAVELIGEIGAISNRAQAAPISTGIEMG